MYRWEQACRRRRILTVVDARLRAKAVRARPAVEAALAERERALTDTDAAVVAARHSPGTVRKSKRMRSHGRLGVSLTGLSPREFGRVARQPTPSARRGRQEHTHHRGGAGIPGDG